MKMLKICYLFCFFTALNTAAPMPDISKVGRMTITTLTLCGMAMGTVNIDDYQSPQEQLWSSCSFSNAALAMSRSLLNQAFANKEWKEDYAMETGALIERYLDELQPLITACYNDRDANGENSVFSFGDLDPLYDRKAKGAAEGFSLKGNKLLASLQQVWKNLGYKPLKLNDKKASKKGQREVLINHTNNTNNGQTIKTLRYDL